MTKRKIPEDFKPFGSDPKRCEAESSSGCPEKSEWPYIENIKFEKLCNPLPVELKVELIGVIEGDAQLIPQQVDQWLKRYKEDYKAATVELLVLVIEACCAKIPTAEELLDNNKIEKKLLDQYRINRELLGDTHVNVVVEALVNIAEKVNIEDYQSSKNFQENLRSFWNHLVLQSQDGPLFDGIVLEKCMNYIIHLSSTSVGIYRQIATLMGLQLVESCITVANSDQFKGITGRKYDDEERKQSEWPLVESLKKTYTSTHKLTVLEQMMCTIFQGLFVRRYVDRVQSIQISCIEALGKWILSYPSLFFHDSHLKYLRWTLIGKSAGVRKASICAMRSIYKVDDTVPALGELTNRISNRMIEFADDMEVSVAVCAIGLVKKLLRDQSHVSFDHLYDFLIDDPARVGPAVGRLVYECLISQEVNSSQSGAKGDWNNSSVHLNGMLRILKEFSGDRILIIYVINDVWEHMAAMEDQKKEKDCGSCFIWDWKCIISMLLNEKFEDEQDATNLVWLLCASVKKVVGERIVPATYIRMPSYTEEEKEQFNQKKQDVTYAMINAYPKLLRRFMDKKEKAAPLIEVILYLDLQLFTLKEFENALELIIKAFFNHNEKEVIKSCVKAFALCYSISQENPQSFAKKIIRQVKGDLTANLLYAKASGDRDSLLANLKKLYELQLSIDIVHNSRIVDSLKSTSESYTNNNDEVVIFQLFNMHMYLKSWVLFGKNIAGIDWESLLNQRVSLSNVLEKLLDIHVGSKCNRKCSWLCIILDEFWGLSKRIDPTTPNLETWRCFPSASSLQKFWNLCLQQLSISDVAEDEDVDKDAVMIAALPWVVGDTISAKENLCPEIDELVNHRKRVAEIVKHLSSFLRKDGDVPNIVLGALKKIYHRHVLDPSKSEDESLASKRFLKFKELAAQLCGTFRGASLKSDIAKVAKDGIDYAFQDAPKQFSFLEGAVLHFVLKLPTDDIQEIKSDVQERVGKLNKEGDLSGWDSYDNMTCLLTAWLKKMEYNEGL